MRNPLIGRVTSEWDLNRIHPVYKTEQPHHGIDLGAPVGILPYKYVGADVRAVYGGTVSRIKKNWRSGWGAIWGRSGDGVLIRNTDGEHQYYGHLSRVDVTLGQKVSEGQVIGGMGSSGNVTGPHLHLELHTKYSNDANRWQRTRNPRLDFNAAGITPGVDPIILAGNTTGNNTNTEETTLSAAEVQEIKDHIDVQADRIINYITERTTVEVSRSGVQVSRSLSTILDGIESNVGALVLDTDEMVSWTDTATGEVKLITVAKALGNLSILAGREAARDATIKDDVRAIFTEEDLIAWRDSSSGEGKKFTIAEALGYLSLHWVREVERDNKNDNTTIQEQE